MFIQERFDVDEAKARGFTNRALKRGIEAGWLQHPKGHSGSFRLSDAEYKERASSAEAAGAAAAPKAKKSHHRAGKAMGKATGKVTKSAPKKAAVKKKATKASA